MKRVAPQYSADERIEAEGSRKRRRLQDLATLPWMPGFSVRYEEGEPIEDVVHCICGFSCPDVRAHIHTN